MLIPIPGRTPTLLFVHLPTVSFPFRTHMKGVAQSVISLQFWFAPAKLNLSSMLKNAVMSLSREL